MEEGDECLCGGRFEFLYMGACYCSTSPMPPCSRCTSSYLACDTCGGVCTPVEYVRINVIITRPTDYTQLHDVGEFKV